MTRESDPNQPSGFEPGRFAAHWRALEPRLRNGVRRFGLADDHALDDLVSEVALRMFSAGIDPERDTDFLSIAEAIAFRLEVDRRRRERQAGRPATIAASTEAESLDHSLEQEQVETQLAVQKAMRNLDLSRTQRRAVMLMLRGGPYTAVERQQMYRARERLRELFGRLFSGVALPIAKLRLPIAKLRQRYGNPPPTVPAIAAVATAVAIGFSVAAATPSTDATRAATPGSDRIVQPRTSVPTGVEAVRTITPLGDRAATTDTRPAPPSTAATAHTVNAATTARLPSADQPGEFNIVLARHDSIANGSDELGVVVYCDNGIRRTVCEAGTPILSSFTAR